MKLSVIIPTQGRRTLFRALRSIRDNKQPDNVEILVCADTHEPLLSDVSALCKEFDALYLEHDAGHHGFGHPQADFAYPKATGDYIFALGDDDEYLTGALTVVQKELHKLTEPVISLWRIIMEPSPTRPIRNPITLWDEPRIMAGRISGQNICIPNDPAKLYPYESHGLGDYEFILGMIYNWGGHERVVWREEIIALCH